MSFTLHTIETAPKASQSQLEGSLKDFGMIPNLHAVMAEAPKVLEAYKTLHQLFQASSFNNEELTVIWQTINVEHNCHYCIPAHAGVAR
jgi:precorrin-6B methylase 2